MSLRNSKLYEYYIFRKKKALRIRLITASVLILLFALILIFLLSPNPQTVAYLGESYFEMEYGDDLDLSGIKFSYKLFCGSGVVKENPNVKIMQFDKEQLGVQIVIIKYMFRQFEISVNIKPKQLTQPNISIKGDTLIWSGIDNASYYTIYLGATESDLEEYTTVRKTEYNLSLLQHIGEFAVSVCANTDDERYKNSTFSNTLTGIKLDNIEQLQYSNGVLSWQKLNYATSYNIYRNESFVMTTASTSCDISLVVGENNFKVVPETNYEHTIISPIDILSIRKLDTVKKLNWVDGNIVWDEVPYAKYYDIYVDDDLLFSQTNSYLVDSNLSQGIRDIKIIAKGEGKNVEESNVSQFKIVANYQLNIDEGIISWEHLTGYEYNVYIDDELIVGQENNSFNLYDSIKVAGKHIVYVDFVGKEYLHISNSAKLEVQKLPQPSIIYDNTTFTLKVDGQEYDTKWWLNDGDFDGNVSNITKVGDNVVQAQYCTNNKYQLNSNIAQITLNKLPIPTIKVTNSVVTTTNYTGPVEFYANNVSISNNLTELVKVGKYKITAKALAVDTYDIASDVSQAVEVEKLNVPTLTHNKDGTLSTNVPSLYYYNGKQFDGNLDTLPTGKYQITAKALGNGTTTITSESSASCKVYQDQIKLSTYNDQSKNRFIINIKFSTVTSLSMNVLFYKGANNFDSIIQNPTYGADYYIYYNRNGQVADKLILELTAQTSDGYLLKQILEFTV